MWPTWPTWQGGGRPLACRRGLQASAALQAADNRRRFWEQAERELALSRRHGIPLALVAIDIDHFKAINDTHGHLVGDQLTPGQLDQLAHQLPAEKLWEENPRLDLHPQFFNATQLLYEAFNGKFPHPQAVDFQVRITAANPADLALFEPDPAVPLVRALAAGLPERTLLHRLFGEQLAGGEFAEAPAILWQVRQVEKAPGSLTFDIISSSYWLEDIKYADTYEATLPAA